MYKEAANTINEGLSPTARYILAFFSGLFGVVMILVAPPTEKNILFYAFGIFCLLISLASLTKGKIRQFIGSTIGVSLFVLSVWYIITQLTGGPFISGAQAEPSLVNSVLFLLAFGVPGLTYSVKTKFGLGENERKKP